MEITILQLEIKNREKCKIMDVSLFLIRLKNEDFVKIVSLTKKV